MKKFALALLACTACAPAFAVGVCTGTPAGGDIQVTAGAAGSAFIVNTFTMKCSANVFLDYTDNVTSVLVGSASKKGLHQYGGSSDGGQVKAGPTLCATTGCTAAPTPFNPSS